MRILRFPVPFLALLLAAVVAASAQTPPKEPDVPYVPTHEKVVAEMLKIAKVKKSDVLYDLGSGDGRIVITAAKKFGTRGTGIELLPALVREARENAEKAGVSQLAQVRRGRHLRGEHQRRHRGDPLSPARGEHEAASEAARAPARDPDRLAQLRHGRLEAGEDHQAQPVRRGAHRLLLGRAARGRSHRSRAHDHEPERQGGPLPRPPRGAGRIRDSQPLGRRLGAHPRRARLRRRSRPRAGPRPARSAAAMAR